MDNKNINDKPVNKIRYVHKKNDVLNDMHINVNVCECIEKWKNGNGNEIGNG